MATTHSESGGGTWRGSTPEYKAWCSMIARCHVPSNRAFQRYGGRGVLVCDRWRSYEAFLADMGRKPTPKHTLDRIDNSKGYEPGNCRWATWTEQSRNRTDNHVIDHAGERRTLSDWATAAGISVQLLYYRLKHGWTMGEAITVRPGGRR